MMTVALWLALPQEKPEIYEKRVGPIAVVRVAKAPTVDGAGDDEVWNSARETRIGVDLPQNILKPQDFMTLKVVHDGEQVCFLLTWKDSTRSDQHEPYVWSQEDRVYGVGKQVEDVAFLAFELAGRFNANMRAGIDSKWDVWQWKAARTNPVGYAADKLHLYARKRPEGEAEFVKLIDGKFGYIQRLADAGRPVTVKKPVPKSKQGDVVPQFETQVPDGSSADVRAKGSWKDEVWTLELSRRLKTGNADDAEFKLGASLGFGVGFCRESKDEDHLVSMPWTLEFKP